MSADNYYRITRHPLGGYTAIMGFASDDYDRKPCRTDIRFDTLSQAEDYAYQQYSEHGVTYDREALNNEQNR